MGGGKWKGTLRGDWRRHLSERVREKGRGKGGKRGEGREGKWNKIDNIKIMNVGTSGSKDKIWKNMRSSMNKLD